MQAYKGSVDFQYLWQSSCFHHSLISFTSNMAHHFAPLLPVKEMYCTDHRCSSLFLSGPIGSTGLTGAYIPSFLKKEVGSAGQRVQLAPIADPSSSKCGTIIILVFCSLLWLFCVYAALCYRSVLYFVIWVTGTTARSLAELRIEKGYFYLVYELCVLTTAVNQ